MVPAFLKTKGLVKQHIDSFDHFINVGVSIFPDLSSHMFSYPIYQEFRGFKALANLQGTIEKWSQSPNKSICILVTMSLL